MTQGYFVPAQTVRDAFDVVMKKMADDGVREFPFGRLFYDTLTELRLAILREEKYIQLQTATEVENERN